MEAAGRSREREKWIVKKSMLEDEGSVFAHRATSVAMFEGFSQQVPNVVYINHEAVNQNPQGCIDQIGEMFSLRRSLAFQDVDNYKVPTDIGVFTPRQYQPMTARRLRGVMESIDWGLEERIGYRLGDVPRDLTEEELAKPARLLVPGDLQLRFYRGGEIVNFAKK